MTPLRLSTAVLLALAAGPGCDPAAPTMGTRPEAPPGPFSAGRTIDLAAVQGEWVVAKVERPDGRDPAPDEPLRDAAGTIVGDRLTLRVRSPGRDDRTERAALFPDPDHAPKQVDIVPLDGQGRPIQPPGRPREAGPERYAAIYTIDGDTIVVASAGEPDGPRPTEFKPGPGVVVVHLKKKPK